MFLAGNKRTARVSSCPSPPSFSTLCFQSSKSRNQPFQTTLLERYRSRAHRVMKRACCMNDIARSSACQSGSDRANNHLVAYTLRMYTCRMPDFFPAYTVAPVNQASARPMVSRSSTPSHLISGNAPYNPVNNENIITADKVRSRWCHVGAGM